MSEETNEEDLKKLKGMIIEIQAMFGKVNSHLLEISRLLIDIGSLIDIGREMRVFTEGVEITYVRSVDKSIEGIEENKD